MAPNDSFEAEKLAKEQDCAILLVIHDKRILDLSDRITYIENRYLINHSDNDCASAAQPFKGSERLRATGAEFEVICRR